MNSKYLTNELVTRQSRFSFQNYLGILPNPDKILSKIGKSIEVYRELKNDPHVWSCIQSRKSGLLSQNYKIDANNAESSLISFIESVFSNLDLQKIWRDCLEAPLFGYQPLEIIWDYSNSGNKIIPIDVIGKPQEWFVFDVNGKLRFRATDGSIGEELPEYKFINLSYESTYLNPYGESLLAKCYWSVTFKSGSMRFWVNFMEKYGMPVLIGQYQRGATYEESKKLAENLANLLDDAVIVAPSDIKIEMKEATRTSSVDLYRDLIKQCNSEISKILLSQTLTTELDSGSYAAAETHLKVRHEVIRNDMKLVEKAMNQLIKFIIDLNFTNKTYPKFVFVDEIDL